MDSWGWGRRMFWMGMAPLLAIVYFAAGTADGLFGTTDREFWRVLAARDSLERSAVALTDNFGTGDQVMSLTTSLGRALNSVFACAETAPVTDNQKRSRNRARTFEQLEPRMMMSVSQDAAGWTVVTPSADSRIVYVSNSTGNDANDGLSAATAKKTIDAGMSLLREGKPDHLLLKAGDTFTNQTFGNSGMASGRSASEPIYIGSYGTGNRPKVLTGSSTIYHENLGLSYVVIQGIEFDAHNHTVSTAVSGIEMFGSGNFFLLEDCKFSHYHQQVVFDTGIGSRTNVTIRRNVIVDAYYDPGGGGTPFTNNSGIYMSGPDGILIEENFLDRNGGVNGATPTFYDHSIYLQVGCNNVTVRNNILSRSPGPALIAASTGEDTTFITNNLFVASGLAGVSGAINGVDVEFNDNVVTEMSDGGWEFKGVSGGTVSNNVFANADTTGYNYQVTSGDGDSGYGVHDLAISSNVFYNFQGKLQLRQMAQGSISGITVSNNYFQEPSLTQTSVDPQIVTTYSTSSAINSFSGNTYHRGGNSAGWFLAPNNVDTFAEWKSQVEPTAVQQKLSFFDPTRTTVSYAATQGLTSFDALMAEMRNQSRTNWRTEFTADAVNDYIRAGFVLDPIGITPLPAPIQGTPPGGSSVQPESEAGGSSSNVSAPLDASGALSTPQSSVDVNQVTAATWRPASHRFARFERADNNLLAFASSARESVFSSAGNQPGGATFATNFGDPNDVLDTEADSPFDWIDTLAASAREQVFAGLSAIH